MAYWIKRIALRTGEVVTEQELRQDENQFDGPVPAIGDLIEVECRGRRFMAEVVWPARVPSDLAVVPLRVLEVGLDPSTPLYFPPKRGSEVQSPRTETRHECPCCHYRTLNARGANEICPVCFWEDDGQDDPDADTVWGGPNGSLSLTDGRRSFEQCGASDPRHQANVRPPTMEEY